MSQKVKVAVLIVIIVACLGFLVSRFVVGNRSVAGGGGGGTELICTDCGNVYSAKLNQDEMVRLMTGGLNAQPKHTCAACGKAAGVIAMQCPQCGATVASPGPQGMMGAPKCPECKKLLLAPPPTTEGGPVPQPE